MRQDNNCCAKGRDHFTGFVFSSFRHSHTPHFPLLILVCAFPMHPIDLAPRQNRTMLLSSDGWKFEELIFRSFYLRSGAVNRLMKGPEGRKAQSGQWCGVCANRVQRMLFYFGELLFCLRHVLAVGSWLGCNTCTLLFNLYLHLEGVLVHLLSGEIILWALSVKAVCEAKERVNKCLLIIVPLHMVIAYCSKVFFKSYSHKHSSFHAQLINRLNGTQKCTTVACTQLN